MIRIGEENREEITAHFVDCVNGCVDRLRRRDADGRPRRHDGPGTDQSPRTNEVPEPTKAPDPTKFWDRPPAGAPVRLAS